MGDCSAARRRLGKDAVEEVHEGVFFGAEGVGVRGWWRV